MFCKWCGGNIAASDTKCKRCGKEVPALSDCGGFYDLVPNAKKTSNVQPEPVVLPVKPASPTHKPESAREVEPARTKKNSGKLLLGLAVFNAVGFILFILLLVLTASKVNNYSTEVNGLRNDLRTISEKIDFLTEATESVVIKSDAMESTIVLDPVLAEQNVVFTIKINGKESAHEVEADLDLGDYTDTAVITYGMDEQTDVVNYISYTLKEANSTVVFTVECNNEVLTVSYVIDDVAYGLPEAPETCKWQYRFGSDADWEDFPKDKFSQNGTSKTELSIREAALQELIANNKGELELRCEIFRTSIEGGSLTISIEGIKFYE